MTEAGLPFRPKRSSSLIASSAAYKQAAAMKVMIKSIIHLISQQNCVQFTDKTYTRDDTTVNTETKQTQ